MDMDSEYLRLYEVYKNIVANIPDNGTQQHVVMYQPDLYIQMAKDILSLRKEADRVGTLEFNYCMEVQMNMNLLDKLRWCEDTLKAHGVRLPFKCDGSSR